MKESLALLCGIILFSFVQLPAQDLQWIRNGSSPTYHGAQVFAIANDKDGNVYTAGHIPTGNVILGNNVVLSNTGNDVFLAKYDSEGTVLWGKTIGNAYWGSSVEMDLKLDASGNVYVMANFGFGDESTNKVEGVALRYNHFFIAKYSPSGEFGWVKGYGGCVDNFDYGSSDACVASAITIDKNSIYVTGHFRYSVKFDNIAITPTKQIGGGIDMFVAKMDLSGNVQFAKKFGTETSEYGRGIAVDKTGNIYVTGEGVGLAKYSNNGTLLQQKFAYTLNSGSVRPIGVGVDAGGNVYQFTAFNGEGTLGGKTIKSANRTALLIKYNSALDVQWHRSTKQDSKYSYLFSLSDGMETDSLGNTYICGDAENGLEFDEVYTSDGLFVIKFDATGAIKGANTIFTYDGNAHDVSVSPDGKYYLGGSMAYDLLVAAYKDTLKNTSPSWEAVKNLRTARIAGRSIELRWDDISDKEGEFIVERSTKPDRNFRYWASVFPDTTYYADTQVLDEFTYYYRVYAIAPGKYYSKYSNVVQATTPLAPPAVPTDFTASQLANSTDIQLKWKTGEKTKRVLLEVSVGNTQNYTVLVDQQVPSASATYPNALADTPYYFRIKAFNNAGGSPSGDIQYYNGKMIFPERPDKLVASALSDTQVALTWSDNATAETGYVLYRAKLVQGPYAIVDTVAANATSATVGSLRPNSDYYFAVKAIHYGIPSGYSNFIGTTTLPSKPAQPAGEAKVLNTVGVTEYSIPIEEGFTYQWTIEPEEAGTIAIPTEESARIEPCACSKIIVTWNPEYAGNATIKVQAIARQGASEAATFNVTVLKPLAKAASPQGTESVCDNIERTDYTTTAVESSESYQWVLDPTVAGDIEGSGTTVTVRWNKTFVGQVALRVGASNELETGEVSEPFYIVKSICSVTAIEEQDPASRISIFPNPAERMVEIQVRPTLVNAAFEIIRQDGVLITHGVLHDTSTKLDVSNLSGLYLVKIATSNGTTYHKLWVK